MGSGRHKLNWAWRHFPTLNRGGTHRQRLCQIIKPFSVCNFDTLIETKHDCIIALWLATLQAHSHTCWWWCNWLENLWKQSAWGIMDFPLLPPPSGTTKLNVANRVKSAQHVFIISCDPVLPPPPSRKWRSFFAAAARAEFVLLIKFDNGTIRRVCVIIKGLFCSAGVQCNLRRMCYYLPF